MSSDDLDHPSWTALLADALADLPKAEAEVLWLYHADGLSFEEIGNRMGLSRRSIRGIWSKGLKNLKLIRQQRDRHDRRLARQGLRAGRQARTKDGLVSGAQFGSSR